MTAGRSATAVALVCLAAAAPATAQVVLEPCALEVTISPPPPIPADLITVRMEGLVPYCASARLAAIGDPPALDLPPEHASPTNLVLGFRPDTLDPGTNCPTGMTPFAIEATLPQPRPQQTPPAIDELGFFMRFEHEDGSLATLLPCGLVPVPVDESAADVLPLHGGRFRAEVDWDTGFSTGAATVSGEYHGATGGAGVFWFFNPHNPELLLKILDGCTVNGHWWVLAAASTNVGYTLRITDTLFQVEWSYENPRGRSSPAITDVAAFGCGIP